MDRKWRTKVADKVSDNFKKIDPRHKSNDEYKPNTGKGIQYFECEGFGHIKTEFSTFLKKQKKVLSNTWYDFDNESEE